MTFALLGSVLLMLVLGRGIAIDVEDMRFAVLYLFATTSMGIFTGTVARSMPQLGLLMILILLSLQLLSGGVTPPGTSTTRRSRN